MNMNANITPLVKSASTADEPSVIDVVVLAFSADPAARWTWRDPHQYFAYFPRFVKAFGGKAFAHGSAYTVEDYAGAALWLPPGVEPDEDTMAALLESSVPEHTLSDVSGVLEQMGRFHPNEPHWYLPLMGVDPMQQGRGIGSALMQHALAACDRDGALAYLESSNPRNVPLYERHGFELLGTIQVGTSPTVFPMLRKPR
jgi:ribosomal protein S18 acetylase RimI-like enzyme